MTAAAGLTVLRVAVIHGKNLAFASSKSKLGHSNRAVQRHHAEVGEDHWPVSDDDPVNDPQRACGHEQGEHSKREIARVAGPPRSDDLGEKRGDSQNAGETVSYTHLRAHETRH